MDRGGSLDVNLVRVSGSLPEGVDVVVAPVGGSRDDIAAWFGLDLGAAAEQLGLKPAPGSLASIPLAGVQDRRGAARGSPLVILAGFGDGSPIQSRRAGAVVGGRIRGKHTVLVLGLTDRAASAFVEGLILGHWQPQRTGRNAEPVQPPSVILADVDVDLEAARRRAEATLLTRDLAAMPSNIKNPRWLAQQVAELTGDVEGLAVTVKDVEQLEAEGFGGLLAVGAGSVSPPCLVTVEYTPKRRRRAQHVVLVGKGITFDTGGISIKPREAMIPMKTDMAGSAAVLAAVIGAAQAQVPVRVTAVMALAENHFGASSYRPGDVVRIWGGTTVEVANTDAEGRMVLADAMAWALATLKPDVMVDVATLTGAATMGLGRGYAALYSEDTALAQELTRAGEHAGERLWRMPLVGDYRSALESDIADLRHVPQTSPGGGSITAALFLQRFAGAVRWAHLDIAGPARSEKATFEIPKGPTGFGARLLLEWLGA